MILENEHGDLDPRNILAQNGKIAGIADWENTGWFSGHWGYTGAHYAVRGVVRWPAGVVGQAFEGYREELYVENYAFRSDGHFLRSIILGS